MEFFNILCFAIYFQWYRMIKNIFHCSSVHSEVMQRAGDVQTSLARELAEYEMQVERDVLAPMSSLLEVT